MSLGPFQLNSIFAFKFDTRVAGEATSLLGSPSLAIYKDSDTAELTAGITLTVDFDGKTGLNHVDVDLSASASYTEDSEYDIVIAAGTVGGVSQANRVVEHFSMRRAQNAIRKNKPLANFEFLLVLASDHITPATGLTVTAQRSIDGAAFAACANAAAEVAVGVYKIDLAAADLNGDVITLRFTAATADARLITIVTEP